MPADVLAPLDVMPSGGTMLASWYLPSLHAKFFPQSAGWYVHSKIKPVKVAYQHPIPIPTLTTTHPPTQQRRQDKSDVQAERPSAA